MLGMTTVVLALAQAQPTAACPITPLALPAELAGWRAGRVATASAQATGAPALSPGQGTRVALHPIAHVSLPVRPAKPGPGGHAGLLAFHVPRAGRYRVLQGAPGWMEMVRNGRAIASTTHGHGPQCSGIRKMVDFDLGPGRHVLELVGVADPVVTVMVQRID